MALSRRLRYSRHAKYVAVKRIRLSRTEYLEPGEEIPEGMRRWRVLFWWKRGYLEEVNSDRASERVTAHKERLEREAPAAPEAKPAKKKRSKKVKKITEADPVAEVFFPTPEEPDEG